MIDPNTINTLINVGPRDLAQVLANSGYEGNAFETVVFRGINVDGNFVYEVTYFDEAGTGETEQGYVFITYNHELGSITAEF